MGASLDSLPDDPRVGLRVLCEPLAGVTQRPPPRAETADRFTARAVAAVPERTSGRELRGIVRRAVLSADETGLLSAAALLAEVGSGRYRATIPHGRYLR